MNKKFFEYGFRTLFIFFWIIIWYKWVALSISQIEILLVNSFCILSLFYMILYFNFSKKNNESKIITTYKISILICFITSLFSFIVFPTNLLLLNIKSIFVVFATYISYKMLFKYKIEEGLVGIISSILLFVITFLY